MDNTNFITSTLNRTLQTARLAKVKVHAEDANLDEIDAGDYDQLTYEQIRHESSYQMSPKLSQIYFSEYIWSD